MFAGNIFDSNPRTYAPNNQDNPGYVFEAEKKVDFRSLVMMKRFDGMRDRYQGLIPESKRVASYVNKAEDSRDIFCDHKKIFVSGWIMLIALKCAPTQNSASMKILNLSFLISKKNMFEKSKFFSKPRLIENKLPSVTFKYFTPKVTRFMI